MKNINSKLLFPTSINFVFIEQFNPFGNAISGRIRFKKEIRPHSNTTELVELHTYQVQSISISIRSESNGRY